MENLKIKENILKKGHYAIYKQGPASLKICVS